MADVIRDFKVEKNIKINSLSKFSLIKGEQGYVRRHKYREFLAKAVIEESINWDVMYFDNTISYELMSGIWHALQKATDLNRIACQKARADLNENAQRSDLPSECDYIPFSTIHWQGLYKLLFQNFILDKKLIDLHDPILKRTRMYEWQGLYGSMFEWVPRGMFYNTKLANKLGIDVPTVGMTWLEFESALKKVHEFNAKQHKGFEKIQALGVGVARGFMEHLQLSMIEHKQTEGFMSVPKGFSSKSHLNELLGIVERLKKYDPLLIESLLPAKANLADVQAYEGKSEGEAKRPDWFQKQTLEKFLSGKILFYAGEWRDFDLMREIDASKAGGIAPAEYPSVNPRTTIDLELKGGFVVMAESSKKKEAREFLEFISRPRYQRQWMKYTKTISGIAQAQTIGSTKSKFVKFFKLMLKKYKKKRTTKEIWDLFEKTHLCYQKNTLKPEKSLLYGATSQKHYHTWEMNLLSWYQILSNSSSKEQTIKRILSACDS